MTIASEIQRINTNIANAYTECNNKGATMPVSQNSANLAECIASISTGSSATLITKTITSNGTYNASSDNADGYSSVVVDVEGGVSNVVGISYDNTTFTTTNPLNNLLNVNDSYSGSVDNNSIYLIVSNGNYYTTNSLRADESDITLVARINVSNSGITSIDMYVSGFTTEYTGGGETYDDGVNYVNSNNTIVILKDYLNDIYQKQYPDSTLYLSDVTLTYNSNSYSFDGNAITTYGSHSMNLGLNAWGSGSVTTYYRANINQNDISFQSQDFNNDAEFSLTYTVNNNIIDLTSIVVKIYTSGWETDDSGGGGETDDDNITIDTANNTITFKTSFINNNGGSWNTSYDSYTFAWSGWGFSSTTLGYSMTLTGIWSGGTITEYLRIDNNNIQGSTYDSGGAIARLEYTASGGGSEPTLVSVTEL